MACLQSPQCLLHRSSITIGSFHHTALTALNARVPACGETRLPKLVIFKFGNSFYLHCMHPSILPIDAAAVHGCPRTVTGSNCPKSTTPPVVNFRVSRLGTNHLHSSLHSWLCRLSVIQPIVSKTEQLENVFFNCFLKPPRDIKRCLCTQGSRACYLARVLPAMAFWLTRNRVTRIGLPNLRALGIAKLSSLNTTRALVSEAVAAAL